MILFLSPTVSENFLQKKNSHVFDEMMTRVGQTFRAVENRHTQRITLNKKNYFLKQHFGIGWKEIFKNLLQLRLPIISAKNEWRAIQRARALKIPSLTIVSYGSKGMNPARKKSFLLTEELEDVTSLEDYCRDWKKHPPAFSMKLSLIKKVARIARLLHDNGINHRDFYICHFLLQNTTQDLYLIDLHRAQIRKQTPKRWRTKDLAGLFFSSKDIGLTQRDLWRFMCEYRQMSLRKIFASERNLWKTVQQHGEELYQRHEKK